MSGGVEIVDSWSERIRCPECQRKQAATVLVLGDMPWDAVLVHDCEGCGYTITESDWEKVPE